MRTKSKRRAEIEEAAKEFGISPKSLTKILDKYRIQTTDEKEVGPFADQINAEIDRVKRNQLQTKKARLMKNAYQTSQMIKPKHLFLDSYVINKLYDQPHWEVVKDNNDFSHHIIIEHDKIDEYAEILYYDPEHGKKENEKPEEFQKRCMKSKYDYSEWQGLNFRDKMLLDAIWSLDGTAQTVYGFSPTIDEASVDREYWRKLYIRDIYEHYTRCRWSDAANDTRWKFIQYLRKWSMKMHRYGKYKYMSGGQEVWYLEANPHDGVPVLFGAYLLQTDEGHKCDDYDSYYLLYMADKDSPVWRCIRRGWLVTLPDNMLKYHQYGNLDRLQTARYITYRIIKNAYRVKRGLSGINRIEIVTIKDTIGEYIGDGKIDRGKIEKAWLEGYMQHLVDIKCIASYRIGPGAANRLVVEYELFRNIKSTKIYKIKRFFA